MDFETNFVNKDSHGSNEAPVTNKLICSFKSGLPNEIDFAMQIATILANTDNFIWSKDHQLVDAICTSLHSFVCVCNEISCYCYPKFWRKLLTKNNNRYLQIATLPSDIDPSFADFDQLEEHEFKDQCEIHRRIKTVAELIKQFSMTTEISKSTIEVNAVNLDYNNYQSPLKKKKSKASAELLKFISLLFHCDDKSFNLIAFDTLSNIASKLAKLPDATNDLICSKLVQMFQEKCIDCISCQDGDIYLIIRSMEIVTRLISCSSKSVTLNITRLMTDKNIVLRVEQFLTSQYDVTLFLSALECCYRISRHQPHLLTSNRARHLMKILVILLNCDESRYFTQKALRRIKISGINLPQPSFSTPIISKPVVNVKSTSIQPVTTASPTNVSANLTMPKLSIASTTSSNIITQSPSTTAANIIASPVITTNATSTPTITPSLPQAPSTGNTPSNEAPVSTIVALPKKEYACEWNGCNQKFSEAKQVHIHVFEVHIGPLRAETLSSCLWSTPEGTGPGCLTKRPKFSLLTHLNDFHCSQSALERALHRTQPTIKPPLHPGYAPNAALLAIRRHANSQRELLDSSLRGMQNESPLSTSVRLTAALILRNLVNESSDMKQALKCYESILSEICMSGGRDEAKIIAECLSIISKE